MVEPTWFGAFILVLHVLCVSVMYVLAILFVAQAWLAFLKWDNYTIGCKSWPIRGWYERRLLGRVVTPLVVAALCVCVAGIIKAWEVYVL